MPGILGIGVDVVHLPRIAALLHRRGPQRLASRILSESEVVDWQRLNESDSARKVSYLAVRYDTKTTMTCIVIYVV